MRLHPPGGPHEPEPPAAAEGSADSLIWLRYVVALAIVLGIFFRFYHLDRKTFWEDEIVGTIHALGYSEAEIVAASPRLHDAAALQVYFRLPERAHGGGDRLTSTVRSLAAEDPQHPPLYYILSHLWARAFGTSVAAMRSLPALFGLLALIAMYGLSKELFASRSIAWLSVALLAVSPFQVLYSQEAREYTLWSICILVSSMLLLRAGRTGSAPLWIAYAASLVVGLYVFPFSLLVIAGHAVYVFGSAAMRKRGPAMWFLSSSAVALLSFAPWLRIMLASNGLTRGMNGILSTRSGLAAVALNLAKDLKTSLFDFGFFRIGPLHSSAINAVATLVAVGLLGYAAYVLTRSGRRNATAFILVGLTLPAVVLVAHDVVFGGGIVEQGRYLMPLYLAATISLAFLFDTTLRQRSSRRAWWAVAFVAVLFGGTVSCVLSAQANTWWNKDYERTPQVAAIVNAAHLPLVAGDIGSSRALGLGYYLHPSVLLRLHLRCDQCSVTSPVDTAASPDSGGPSDVFFLGSGGYDGRVNHRYVIGIKTFPLRADPLNMFLSPQ